MEERICKCGCGRTFPITNIRRFFIDKKHHDTYYNRYERKAKKPVKKSKIIFLKNGLSVSNNLLGQVMAGLA
jgi:hypothetical protein